MKQKIRSVWQTEYPAIEVDASAREAAAKLKQYGAHWLTVTANRHVVGLVSAGDVIRKVVIGRRDPDQTAVESIMRIGLPTCSPNTTLAEVTEIMKRKRTRQVAVVSEDGRTVMGIVRAENIIRAVEPKSLDPEFLVAVLS